MVTWAVSSRLSGACCGPGARPRALGPLHFPSCGGAAGAAEGRQDWAVAPSLTRKGFSILTLGPCC